MASCNIFLCSDWLVLLPWVFFLRFCLRHSIYILVLSKNVRSITDGDILNDRGVNCRAVSVRGITR